MEATKGIQQCWHDFSIELQLDLRQHTERQVSQRCEVTGGAYRGAFLGDDRMHPTVEHGEDQIDHDRANAAVSL